MREQGLGGREEGGAGHSGQKKQKVQERVRCERDCSGSVGLERRAGGQGLSQSVPGSSFIHRQPCTIVGEAAWMVVIELSHHSSSRTP